MEADSRSLPTI